MRRGILWYGNDLRVSDNRALFAAAEACEEVLPIYIFDPEYLHRSNFGSRKFGARRVKFILESLSDLKRSLKGLGNDLMVLVGNPVELIPKLAEEHGVTKVFAHKEVTREEKDLEESVRQALPSHTDMVLFHGHTLFHPEDIPFDIDSIPDVFSSFRKKCEKYAEVREIVPIPEKLKSIDGVKFSSIPSLKELGFEEIPISPKAAIAFVGGERQARKRMERYFWESENLSRYKFTRNGLLGEDYSSKFSAWLSAGCISPRIIKREVERYERKVKKNVSTYWLIFELIWRDYFRYVAMKYGDNLFYPGGIKGATPMVNYDEGKLEAWKEGRTGVPFIDANMRELNETGFMSNRGRQNVASYLVKDLKQDWRRGAAYFEEQLIDYDVTSNWGNWAYVAGVGNDPRENRYFNILSQADRYDGKGEYVKHWLPELKDVDREFVQTPWKLPDGQSANDDIDGTVYARPVYVNPRW